MKKLLIVFIICIGLSSCGENPDAPQAYKHELRKFNVKNSATSSGWYFLVGGSYSSSDETTVRLYYKEESCEYIFMERPIDQIAIKIENVKHPYLTNPRAFVVVIHCREEDFQPEVNINSLK